VIVVDSSVWIAQLRGAPIPVVRKLEEASRSEDILIGDLILLEVLQGARDDRHAAEVERSLRRFPVHPMLGDAVAVKAAANYRFLRSRGITIRKTIDMIIATFCLQGGHVLLHDDRDFDFIAEHLPLVVA
jgi:predicted nucleic acid-binding protein